MPVKLQIPTFAAISDNPAHDINYLKAQLLLNPDFMLDGQIYINRALNRLYFKSQTPTPGVVSLNVDNLSLIDTVLTSFGSIFSTNNPVNITTLADVQTILMEMKNTIDTYVLSRTPV